MNRFHRRPFALPILAGASALAVLALPGALAQTVDLQDQEEPRFRGLVRVLPEDPQAADTQSAPFESERWAGELSATNLDARMESYERLLAEARRNPAARAWIEEVAAEGRGELAWTARMALRDLRRSLRGSPSWISSRDLDQIEEQLEMLTDRFAPGWNHRVDPFVVPFPGLHGQNPLGSAVTTQARRVDVQNGADGWTIRVTEEVDGEESVREFTGATLEEILEANPDLKGEIGISGSLIGPGIRLRIGSSEDEPFDFDALFGNLGVRPPLGSGASSSRDLLAEVVRTDILGVIARPVTEDEGGEGLYVRSTVPGTIAALLGIQPGDVLLSVNDVELATVDDVTRGLEARPDDGRVQAAWRDGEGRRRTGTWRP